MNSYTICTLFTLFTTSLIMSAEPVLPTKNMAQVGIVVPDIEKAKIAYAELFGMEVPDTIQAENPDDNPTTYNGKLTEGSCYLAFFNLENIQLELIEPIGTSSTWAEFLDSTQGKGGIHHIAFWIKGMDGQVKKLQMSGMKEIQHGGWTGGQYSYVEGSEGMGVILELLEDLSAGN